MRVTILTSGFPDGFPDNFIKCIKKYYSCEGSFLFIASNFSAHSKTDEYLETFLSMFKNKGVIFNEVNVLDGRITKEKSLEYIKKSDIIWIAGGDTLMQIESLREYNLISALNNREGITIGMSAGSINLAKRVVLAKDMECNVTELVIYEGIGLVDINIEPHLDTISEEHIKDVYEASQHTAIYGIYDNAFVKVADDKVRVYGDFLKFEKGRIS